MAGFRCGASADVAIVLDVLNDVSGTEVQIVAGCSLQQFHRRPDRRVSKRSMDVAKFPSRIYGIWQIVRIPTVDQKVVLHVEGVILPFYEMCFRAIEISKSLSTMYFLHSRVGIFSLKTNKSMSMIIPSPVNGI